MTHFKNLFIKGDIYCNKIQRVLYSTDASVYKEEPRAIIRPKDKEDIKAIIALAQQTKTSIIPRAAGTSLAGQVVGNGMVVDISKYMNKILEINETEKWVRVQPGVVLDELNKELERFGLFFGPETSSSNRCMIGGMVGNNSCGSHSLVYGSTRDHTLSVKTILSDGSEVEFKALNNDEFQKKCQGHTLENKIYQNIQNILSTTDNQTEIRKEFPDKDIKRRNTGYAIDILLETNPFTPNGTDFNFSKLICGSEGTLAIITEIKLNLVPLPPKQKVLVCVHCKSVKESLYANLLALNHQPSSIELMDHIVLECTKNNIAHQKNRFFVKGDPCAILIVEFMGHSKKELKTKTQQLIHDFKESKMGYHYPLVWGDDISKVWSLRKAGLGLLSNIPGDKKPVAVVEDTAVNPKMLPYFIEDFDNMLKKHHLSCVYYAHISTGELHLRPVLNLKDPKDVKLFHTIALETAHIVKKHKGSLSGEHGDGRLRGEFIPLMIGNKNYQLLKEIKQTWDPNNVFNPNKIVDTPKMNTFLRYQPGQKTREFNTYFNFDKDKGLLRAVEKCNGSGDCRKTEIIGGIMCPSFMATKDEDKTTRARANILREYLTHSTKKNPFNHKEIYNTLDLCLSCKGCKSECPSSVDITKYKAEFLQHYYNANGVPLRSRLIANITKINQLGLLVPPLFNYVATNAFLSSIFKIFFGFAPKRNIPIISKITLRSWLKKNRSCQKFSNGKVYLFADEFTNYNDTKIGITAIKLLYKMGYEVVIPNHVESGRTFLSKGLLKKAKKLATQNVLLLKNIISEEHPLIGIEPSGILTFRDEYPELVDKTLIPDAQMLANNTLMFEEFIMQEVNKGKIKKDIFTRAPQKIKLHGHCHQKSIASIDSTKNMLSLPENYKIYEIKSGCCGMAGSFGYEKKHYDLSIKIGELVLFPEVRTADEFTIISAPGTSCRQQIKDGTGKTALHPIEVLFKALTI